MASILGYMLFFITCMAVTIGVLLIVLEIEESSAQLCALSHRNDPHPSCLKSANEMLVEIECVFFFSYALSPAGAAAVWCAVALMCYGCYVVVKFALFKKLPQHQFQWHAEDVPEDVTESERTLLLAAAVPDEPVAAKPKA